MANAQKNNVLVVDTAAQFNQALRIKKIKVVNANGAAQTSTVKVGGASGTTLYSSAVAANSEKLEEVRIFLGQGDAAYITPGTTCTVYVYLE